MVSTAKPFPVVAGNFFRFIKEQADEQDGISEIILVGHNAKVFDIPWLMHQLTVHGILGDGRFNYGMDTFVIAKTAIKNDKKSGSPSAYNLPTLFKFVSGRLPETGQWPMSRPLQPYFAFFGKQEKNVISS
jgi:DNA polymerase III epsilon subunit-like protein